MASDLLCFSRAANRSSSVMAGAAGASLLGFLAFVFLAEPVAVDVSFFVADLGSLVVNLTFGVFLG